MINIISFNSKSLKFGSSSADNSGNKPVFLLKVKQYPINYLLDYELDKLELSNKRMQDNLAELHCLAELRNQKEMHISKKYLKNMRRFFSEKIAQEKLLNEKIKVLIFYIQNAKSKGKEIFSIASIEGFENKK